MKPVLLTAALVLSAGAAWAVGSALQVTAVPALGPAPTLVMPTVESGTLPNGLKILVSRNAEVPLIEARLVINGGARLTGVTPGMATFAAGMVTEGAGGRDAFQLAEAIDFVGASLGANAGWENITVRLSVPRRNIDSALVLMRDITLHPTFAAADVARQRDLRQAGLVAARDNPGAVAQRVYYRSVYPTGHPYHESLSGDSATTAGLDSAGVRAFWNGALDPKAATLIVAGDVTLKEATAWATKYFGDWASPATPMVRPAAGTVPSPAATATRVILVDKPNAAQSVIMLGQPGVARTSPDYPAITIMNTLLGGSFSSRLNHILREERGYTYGASSGYSFAPVAGPFIVSSAVRTDVTDSSLAVMMRELKRIRDTTVAAEELARTRSYVTLGMMEAFETAGDIAGAIQMVELYGMTLGRIGEELETMKGVRDADLQRVARQYLDPDKLTIVIVGDLKQIRAKVEKLKLGPVTVETY